MNGTKFTLNTTTDFTHPDTGLSQYPEPSSVHNSFASLIDQPEGEENS